MISAIIQKLKTLIINRKKEIININIYIANKSKKEKAPKERDQWNDRKKMYQVKLTCKRLK
jgi:hypothetical protein